LEADKLGHLFFAQEYMELSAKQIDEELDVNGEVKAFGLLFNLMQSYNKSRLYTKAIATLDRMTLRFGSGTDLVEMRNNLKELETSNGNAIQLNPFVVEFVKTNRYSVEKEAMIVAKGCREGFVKPPAEVAKLRCRYVSNSLFSKIAPFKIEEANLEPYLAIYYDVMSDKESEYFINITMPNVQRAKIVPTAASVKSNVRVAQLAWHFDSDKYAKRITRRVNDMTGMNMETAEGFQVQNYGIGGHYSAHWDHTLKNQDPFNYGTGNRIATVLFYVR